MASTEHCSNNSNLPKIQRKKHRRQNKNNFQSGTALPNNTYNYGSITDRFLPINNGSPERKVFYHEVPIQSLPSTSDTPVQINDNIVSISSWLEDSSNSSINEVDILASSGTTELVTNSSPAYKNKKKDHKEEVASALGLQTERFLHFKTFRSIKRQSSLQGSDYFESDIHMQSLTNKLFGSINTCDSSFIAADIPEVPFKVLDAPGLRNDYYSNLVCWAKKSDHIAAGLGSIVYVWSEKDGTIPLKPFGNQLISALSYSSEDYLAVGTKNSKIFIYSPNSIDVFTHMNLKASTSICSIRWIPQSKYFFVGNDVGEITLIKLVVKNEKNIMSTKLMGFLKIIVSFKCAQQQICGIDVNPTSKQLAIGDNSNRSTIWDISNLGAPKMLFNLRHEAAVKAIAFCPWVPNLLATGGGTRDKHLRFWHTTSGTLISKHKTNGQITAVVWSKSKKEILVTFGFGETAEKNNILAVYSYPSLKMKVKVNAPADMRILSADISNDFKSVCTSISDQSVRIYNVWDSEYDFRLGIYEKGIYGSDIINAEEGVDKNLDTIR